MFQMMTKLSSSGGALLALCVALAGCSARTYVSGTGSTPSEFTHLYITTQEVWFNTSASAGPDDGGWAKFPLTTPVTIDLVTESNGTLGQIAGDLRVSPGTYNSILLLPYISSTAAASATALGATYNQEADWVDTAGTSHTVSLVIPNVEKGIIVPGASLTVPVGGGGLPLGGSTSSTTTGTTNTASTLFNQPTTVNSTTGTTSTSGTNNTVTVSFATSWDLNRDLHLFNWNTANTTGSDVGVLMSPGSGVSTDLSATGAISGTLTLTSLTNINSISDRVAIQACAETLSADTTHYQVVLCAPVQTDGTFTIYPLQSNSSTATNYEVVIHGPNIETIIIHSVPATTTSPSLTSAASTTGSIATTTAGTPVSLGTFIPTPWASYPVSVSASSSGGLPPGAAVTFYQTLSGSGAVPYAIDEVGIDPVNLNLQTNETLSAGPVQSGTYSSSGSAITVTSQAAHEGAGNYLAAAVAPLYTDGIASASTKVNAPSGTTVVNATSSTTPVAITIPGLSLGSGSISAAIALANTANYTGGELLVSHNGVVIGAASLNGVISGGGSVTVSGLPTSQEYYLSAILWNAGGQLYESLSSAPITVSGSSATSTSVTIN
jgi:trimeric autotransporter adhesin